jgi:aldose 1-epimerase
MFTITKTEEAGFKKIILADDNSGTKAEIIPQCGAILHLFGTTLNNSFINVIENYESADDFAANVTSKGFRSCKLSPFVCRIKNATYNFGQKKYTIEKFLLGSSALHGLLYDVDFTIMDETVTGENCSVTLKNEYLGTDKGFPFTYTCEIKYTLTANCKLFIETTITNNGNSLMPVADGWHPYFTFGESIDECQLEFQSKEMLQFDKELIPSGKLLPYQEFGSLKKIKDAQFDNCFTVNFAECQPMCVVRCPSKKVQVEIYPDKTYPYLQLYIPPHRQSIAIENLSAAPDAFNNGMGLITLSKGKTASFITSYKISAID